MQGAAELLASDFRKGHRFWLVEDKCLFFCDQETFVSQFKLSQEI